MKLSHKYKVEIEYIAIRVLALLIRFSIPISILAISSKIELGRYYLAISFFSFCTTFLAFEYSTAYAAKYMDILHNKESIYSEFIFKLFLISFTLALIPFLFLITTSDLSFFILLCIPIVFSLEAISIETGRFLINIGDTVYSTKRELLKSIILSISVIISVYILDVTISWLTVIIYLIGTCMILYNDKKFFGCKNYKLEESSKFLSIKTDLIQPGRVMIRGQLINSNQLIERYFIDKTLGLEIVGIYSLYYSIIQASSSILLMKSYSLTRRLVILELLNENLINKTTKQYFKKLVIIVLLMAVLSYLMMPFISYLTNQNKLDSIFLCFIASLSIISGSLIYTFNPREVHNNIILDLRDGIISSFTLLLIIPFVSYYQKFTNDNTVFMIIILSITLQFVVFFYRTNKYGKFNRKTKH
jgi:hypothetical protein